MADKKQNKPVFVLLRFLAETIYKGVVRKKGAEVEVDESWAKNFVAQEKAEIISAKKKTK